MNYIYKQKFQLTDLVPLPELNKKVLIYEPSYELGQVYSQHLSRRNYLVTHCTNLELIKQHLVYWQPHLVLFSIDGLAINLDLFAKLSGLRQDQGLQVITLGYEVSDEILKKLMSMGVASHVNRKLSRPRDLVEIIDNVLA